MSPSSASPVPGPGQSGEAADAGPAAPRSRSLTVAGCLVGAQGALLVGFAAYYAVEIPLGAAADAVAATLSAVMALLAGGCLLLVARGLIRARGWSRTPALVTQLLVVPTALPAFERGNWFFGVPLLVWAAAILVLLFTPSANAALRHEPVAD